MLLLFLLHLDLHLHLHLHLHLEEERARYNIELNGMPTREPALITHSSELVTHEIPRDCYESCRGVLPVFSFFLTICEF